MRYLLRVIFLLLAVILLANKPITHSEVGATLSTNKNEYLFFSKWYGTLNSSLMQVLRKELPSYKEKIHNNTLTVIDFSLPSTEKRLWCIDLGTGNLLYNTYVAHGKNSGCNFAQQFSNTLNSYQSSLGFYLTADIYFGKHGKSMRLHGLEKGINDKAQERAIVVHGADYVSESFINMQGRLGRSHGCPAIPLEITSEFIERTNNGSLFFIYHPQYEKLRL